MKRFLFLAAALSTWLLLEAVGQAQLVQVGPGYVRAPFVRVYTGPDGSSYVRAPFVSIGTPGYYQEGSGSPRRRVNEFADMDWRTLANAVRDWTARLETDLDRSSSGGFWKFNFKTADILRLVPANQDGPPPADVRQELRSIVGVFDSVGSSPDVNRVVNLQSFQMLRAALAEYSTPPEQRARHQLLSASADLNRRLDRFDRAADWQQYLLLSSGLVLSGDQPTNEADLNRTELVKAMHNFDTAAQDSQYEKIANLPEFKTAHARLAAYLQQPPTPAIRSEELPPPQPPQPIEP